MVDWLALALPGLVEEAPLNEARSLHQLQGIDLEVDALTQELEVIQAQIGETEELMDARQRLDEVRRRLHELQSSQQELEWDAQRLGDKIAQEEARLYRGQGRGPRELDAIRREVEHLKRSRAEIEDRTLEVMADVEQTQGELGARQAELARITSEWEAQQRELAERQSEAIARLAQLNQDRRAIASTLPASLLATYEDLRRTKRGRAIARIERNTCQGCHISLPMTIVHRARAGRELVHCPSCGRLLFAER